MHDFLEVYDYKFNGCCDREHSCENAIKHFESVYDESSSKSAGLSYFNKNRQKICASKTFDFGQDLEINPYIYKYVQPSIKSYTEKYDYLSKIDKVSQWRLCPNYNVQRYDGEKEGFFSLHNESSGTYPYRILAWMGYLNNAECGTEFPYQNQTVIPKVGRTVIWPASWTHPHKGVTPNIGLKYIATGWYYHLPKGEPQFNGRHPDEERIQEIIV